MSPAVAIPATSAQDSIPPRPDLRRIGDRQRLPQPALDDTTAARAGADTTPRRQGFPPPDSIMKALMGRPNYRPVVYQGDTLRFLPGDGSIRIYEGAHVQRNELSGVREFEVYSDSMRYDRETGYVYAYGRSTLIDADGEELNSEEGPLFYDPVRRIGTFVGGETQWNIWNVEGDFTLEGSDTLWVNHGIFTSCEDPEPHYHFAADKIKLIFGDIVVAWPVRLYFGDVPVFWFPFFAQDVRQGRRSGILTPQFGVNDIVSQDRGYKRHIANVGYYWAISDYTDAQLAIDWWSGTWFRLDGFFRYRWRQKFLDGRLGVSRFWLPDGARELSLVWNHTQKFGERTDLRASVQFVSSTQFELQNEFNPEQLTQQIRSNINFTRRFDWGNLSLGAQRIQPLTSGEQTVFDVPQLSLQLTPISLTRAPSPLQKSWYHGLTLTGGGNFNRQEIDDPDGPNQEILTGGANGALTLGPLSWSGAATYRDQTLDKPDTLFGSVDTVIVAGDTITADTTILGPNIRTGTIGWQTSLSYLLRLMGSTTLTPGVSLSGSFFRSNQTGLKYVSTPSRLSANASLRTDLYGFFPGFGPFARIRHKFSPSFSWSYSPAVTTPPELENISGISVGEVAERHQLSIGLNQTFEAKRRAARSEEDEASDAPPEQRKMVLLALNTSSVIYDIVDGRVTSNELSNSARSDLLPGFTLQFAHDLFDEQPGGRKFDPFLRRLNLSFSLGDRSFGGVRREPGAGVVSRRGIRNQVEEFGDEELEAEEDTLAREEDTPRQRRPWNLSVDYSLLRERAGLSTTPNRQSIRWTLGFSPTDNWTISWRTQYDIEESNFVDQIVSLRRDLHRWAATFDFLRAANGNFTFDFRVSLNDLPDIKFDYRQETRQ